MGTVQNGWYVPNDILKCIIIYLFISLFIYLFIYFNFDWNLTEICWSAIGSGDGLVQNFVCFMCGTFH